MSDLPIRVALPRGDLRTPLAEQLAAVDFVAEGYGVKRSDVMYNDFIVVGPPSDPAGVRGMKDAAAALKPLPAGVGVWVGGVQGGVRVLFSRQLSSAGPPRESAATHLA